MRSRFRCTTSRGGENSTGTMGIFTPALTVTMTKHMWPHIFNLLSRSWHAMTAATSTNTLGFVLWTIAVTVALWLAAVGEKWWKLRKKAEHPFWEAVESSLLSAIFSAITVSVLVLFAWGWFIMRTVRDDHDYFVALAKQLREANSHLVDPQSRDQKIRELQDKLNAFEKLAKRRTGVMVYPIGHDSRPGLQKMEYVLTTDTVHTPTEFLINCDFPIADVTSEFLTTTGEALNRG
jgi:hypothetical protein